MRPISDKDTEQRVDDNTTQKRFDSMQDSIFKRAKIVPHNLLCRCNCSDLMTEEIEEIKTWQLKNTCYA